jgi:hypothetical protein
MALQRDLIDTNLGPAQLIVHQLPDLVGVLDGAKRDDAIPLRDG